MLKQTINSYLAPKPSALKNRTVEQQGERRPLPEGETFPPLNGGEILARISCEELFATLFSAKKCVGAALAATKD